MPQTQQKVPLFFKKRADKYVNPNLLGAGRSFEDATDDDSFFGGAGTPATLVRTAVPDAFQGSYVGRWADVADAWPGLYIDIPSGQGDPVANPELLAPVTAGVDYTWHVAARIHSGDDNSLVIGTYEFDAEGNFGAGYFESDPFPIARTPDWTVITYSFAPPEGMEAAGLFIYANDSVNSVIDLDGLGIWKGTSRVWRP